MRGASTRAVLGMYVGMREAAAFADDRVAAITLECELLMRFEMALRKSMQGVTKRWMDMG